VGSALAVKPAEKKSKPEVTPPTTATGLEPEESAGATEGLPLFLKRSNGMGASGGCSCGGSAGEDGECQSCRNKRLAVQRKAASTAARASQAPSAKTLPTRIRAAASHGGAPLPLYLWHRLSRHLSADVSRVRIHTGSEADRLARDVQALAFTTGSDIFFRAGQYQPDHPAGLELLAHEVTHTEQQRQGTVSTQASPDSVSISEPSDSFEQEADSVARSFVAGDAGPASVTPTAAPHVPVHRKCAACESGGATCPKCEEEKLKVQRKPEGADAPTGPQGSAEMVPGYQDRYAAAPQPRNGDLLIQRAKIDHRTLTWDDFQKPAPKNATFDAETVSDFADPALDKVIPQNLKAVDTGDKCKVGGKDSTKFKVDITIDPDQIEVKSFMSQDDSWHKAWATDEKAQRAKCVAEFAPLCEKIFDDAFKQAKVDRAKEEAACRKDFDDAKKEVDEQCKKKEADCKAAFKAGDPFEGADSAKECTTVVLKDCKTEGMKGHTYSNGDATATSRSECAKPFGDDFEKAQKDAATAEVTMGGASTTVNSREDCRKDEFLDSCVKDLIPAGSAKLLAHEQNHFDLTDALATKAQADLRALVGTFPKEVVDCGEDAAKAKAKKTLADELKQLNKIFKDAKKEMGKLQSKYDSETQHGSIAEKQAEWEDRVSKGFMKPTP
jgi:hypothetical protein